jgi:O-antigen/teichoic acid export membrane protein
VTWVSRATLARWLNIPQQAVAIGALAVFVFLVRPVVTGRLQGMERFTRLGLTHFGAAAGRLALIAVLFAALGSTTFTAAGSLTGGLMLSLAIGLWFAGPRVRVSDVDQPFAGRQLLVEGWRLSLAALVAYAASMSLSNLDVIVANRQLSAEMAAVYAAAAVMRRVLTLVPSVVTLILFPQIAARVSRGDDIGKPVNRSLAAVIGSGLIITAIYSIWGSPLLALAFGENYGEATSIIGWLAVGMVGYSVAVVWMNTFLATRPWPFTLFLALIAIGQAVVSSGVSELPQLATTFVVAAWTAAVGGAVLYYFWLRPKMSAARSSHSKQS